MYIEVTEIIGKYASIGGEVKKVDIERILRFNTWDDFQNWFGYMVEALEGEPLTIKTRIIKET